MLTNHSGFMIQARNFQGHGLKGNFELVMPNQTGGGLAHFWRDNDNPNLPWKLGRYFGAPEDVSGPSLIQRHDSDWGIDALDIVARVEDRLVHYQYIEPQNWGFSYIYQNAYCLSSENVMLEVFKQA